MIRARVLQVLAEYPSPVPCSTVCNRMPSCDCNAVRCQLGQLERSGKVAYNGTTYRKFYALSSKVEFASMISNLWRREPVLTELRGNIRIERLA